MIENKLQTLKIRLMNIFASNSVTWKSRQIINWDVYHWRFFQFCRKCVRAEFKRKEIDFHVFSSGILYRKQIMGIGYRDEVMLLIWGNRFEIWFFQLDDKYYIIIFPVILKNRNNFFFDWVSFYFRNNWKIDIVLFIREEWCKMESCDLPFKFWIYDSNLNHKSIHSKFIW